MFLEIARYENPFHLCAMKSDLAENERKEWAKLLYTRHGRSVEDTALEVGVEAAAVRYWVRQGKWDQVKRSLLISKTSQLECLYDALEILTSRTKSESEVNTKDIDQIVKYTAAIKNLESETGISYIVQVAEQFTAWLLRKDLDLAKTFALQFDGFINDIPAT